VDLRGKALSRSSILLLEDTYHCLEFGPVMRYQRELVEEIPCEPSGKFRFVISKVPLPFA